jgi:8-oxo-dGTP pyrophosphatase MutT (NUDIX family)
MRASLAPSSLQALFAQKLRPEPPGWLKNPANARGDHSHDPEPVLPFTTAGPPRLAAVLVPVVVREEDPALLFTVRSTGLREHSGQIAFPGGKMNTDEPSPLDTALREADEEIGLSPRHIEPVGYLDPYLSNSNYLITPVVGLVTPPFSLTLDPGEVADTFEVPMGFLLDPAHHELHEREIRGRLRRYYAMPYRDRYIWGVTAGIIRNLYERLQGE